MPGRPSVRTAKSSCFGKISTRIGPTGRELVLLRKGGQGARDDRQRVGLQDVGLLRVEAHERGAVRERLEPVERVEQAQQVERDDVVRIGLERALEHLSRPGLVARAQQVHAQVRLRARVVRVERDGLARERRRLVEPVPARRQLARHAVGDAPGRVHREHARHLGVEVGRAAVHVGHGREQSVGVLALRVRRERRLHRLPGVGVVVVVERQLGPEQVRVDQRGVDLERPGGRGGRGRRVVLGERAREARLRGRPLRIAASAARYDCPASARLCFSRKRSPQAVLTAGSLGARPSASRKNELAVRNSPSARSARASRTTSPIVPNVDDAPAIRASVARPSAVRPSASWSRPSSSAASLVGWAAAAGRSAASAWS